MKKINVRKASDILSDKMLKAVIGGYGNMCQVITCWKTCSASYADVWWLHEGGCWETGEAMCHCGFLCQPCPF